MKILKLIFENINSYEGEVTIDFTDPGFLRGNNQFVVCGPMGSGKSTILDAISLALYGSTDRLGRLTTTSANTSDELINKHSGYCRAEVIYSCSKGVFDSVFELRKAHGKTDGKVQAPECALYEMIQGERGKSLLDGQTTDALKKKTEEIIGLSYEQFIRCILIPQGEFDRFLTSNEREKAGILAKLSHTEHYKEAAAILNEKASSLNTKYINLKGERDAIPVMTEDDRNDCKDKIEEIQKKDAELTRAITEIQNMIDQLNRLKNADEAYHKAEKDIEEVKAGEAEHGRNKEELDKARKAEECSVAYQSLQDCDDDLKKNQEQLKAAEEQLAVYTSKKGIAETEAKRFAEEYTRKKDEREKQKDIWAKVRSLDKDLSVAKNDRNTKEKAFTGSDQEYKEKKAEHSRLESELRAKEDRVKELSGYLEENKADADLGEILAVYHEKKAAWREANTQLEQAKKALKTDQEQKDELQKKITELEKEKTSIEEALRDLVNSKYLLVAGILRKDLKPGKTCPVCGKEYASADDAAHEMKPHTHQQAEEISGEERKAAEDISGLNEQLEEKAKAINETNSILQSVITKTESDRQSIDRENAALSGILKDVNAMLLPWNKTVDEQTSEEAFAKIGDDLSDLKKRYTEKNEEFNALGKAIDAAKTAINSIDLGKMLEKRNEAEKEFNTAKQKYDELEKQRQDLFGTKSVDEAEKALDEEIERKEKEKNSSEEQFQAVKEQYETTNTQIRGYHERKEELDKKRVELNRTFLEKLEKNQFASEEDFLTCKREKEEIEDLDRKIKEYDRKKTAAETTYNNSKETLEKIKAEVTTTEDADTLNARKTGLEEEKKERNQTLGGLTEKLKQDEINRNAWQKADDKLKDLGQEAEIYSRISTMLGKKDGADFEVFVQGIAMRSLLEKANEYLQSIIPKYRLEQKTENSIDFIVNETRSDLTVVKREISNFSGGEKFILSLSLALAMAEFAGRNGDVECIFLDEGFGTLSGDPLFDAINALKKLSSTGKMLGIITHIDAVIQAFNQIEAKKTGEKSILTGPGVTYTETKAKAK